MKRRTVITVLLILALVFIWGNSLLSREASAAVSGEVFHFMNRLASSLGLGDSFFSWFADMDGDGILEESDHLIRKMAHVTEYAVLGILWFLRLDMFSGKTQFLSALFLGVLCAGIDETIQLFSHRGSQLLDVGIDTAGILLGLCIIGLLRRRKEGSNSKKNTA